MANSVWDWVTSKNRRYMLACSKEGVANAMMDLLRGMEVWARDHMLTLEDVEVARSTWTSDGRLVIEFKERQSF